MPAQESLANAKEVGTMYGQAILGFLEAQKGALKNSKCNEDPPAIDPFLPCPAVPISGLPKCNAIPLPSDPSPSLGSRLLTAWGH